MMHVEMRRGERKGEKGRHKGGNTTEERTGWENDAVGTCRATYTHIKGYIWLCEHRKQKNLADSGSECESHMTNKMGARQACSVGRKVSLLLWFALRLLP